MGPASNARRNLENAAVSGKDRGASTSMSDDETRDSAALWRNDLLSRLRARGADHADTLLTEPDYLTGEAFAARIGLTRQALDKRRKAGTVLGLKGEKRGVRYPAWQIVETKGRPAHILPALKETLPDLLAILGGSWSVHTVLTTSWPQVGGRTGLDLLRDGAVPEALDLARSTQYGGGT